MAYPALLQTTASRETQLTGRQLDRATNGAAKVRLFFATTKRVFNVNHALMTSAQKAQLDAFYAANATNSFDFVWAGDSATYTVIFGDADLQWESIGVFWQITVNLVEV